MTAPLITEAHLKDPVISDLYTKYLGTLAVLGDAAARIGDDDDCRESIEMCMADAGKMLRGRVSIRATLQRFDLEPI